jgi:plastocyanin
MAAAAGVAVASGPSVTIADLAYNPAMVVVQPGDTVTWTNNDQASHSVTADDGSFDSAGALCSSSITFGCLRPGQSYTHTFTSSGTFSYHCRVHPSMHGTVVVAAASVTTPPSTAHVTATTLPSTTTSTSLGGAARSTTAPPASFTDNGIGQDLPASPAPGAPVALKGASAKTSSNTMTIAVLIACIALATAGIGAVVYRIRVDRRLPVSTETTRR